MTASFMPGVVHPADLPANWDRVNGIAYCLGCLRKKAGETKSATLSGEDSLDDHRRASAEGRIEFELGRAPDRCDTRIARTCGTSVAAVRGVRERLGAYPTRPV